MNNEEVSLIKSSSKVKKKAMASGGALVELR